MVVIEEKVENNTMHCFYTEKENIVGGQAYITGSDVNHIRNVLRMEIGEEIVICDGEGTFHTCAIQEVSKEQIETQILESKEAETELNVKIILFQGLPKKDKMELIIQKAVELGVHEIVPVSTRFCVAKIEDAKKEKKKLERWQEIAKAAAKQSGRGIIPQIKPVMTYKEALKAAAKMDKSVIPYEKAEGMKVAVDEIGKMAKCQSVGIFIGPEGGFAEEEIAGAIENGVTPISLGKRILRTETAGLCILSVLMFEIEKNSEEA